MNEKYELVATTSPKLNYDTLCKIFLNKDPNAFADETKDFEKNTEEYSTLFLDEQVKPVNCFIASLMRSGNTFFRRLLE